MRSPRYTWQDTWFGMKNRKKSTSRDRQRHKLGILKQHFLLEDTGLLQQTNVRTKILGVKDFSWRRFRITAKLSSVQWLSSILPFHSHVKSVPASFAHAKWCYLIAHFRYSCSMITNKPIQDEAPGKQCEVILIYSFLCPESRLELLCSWSLSQNIERSHLYRAIQ